VVRAEKALIVSLRLICNIDGLDRRRWNRLQE
jgi:hypothetical protein